VQGGFWWEMSVERGMEQGILDAIFWSEVDRVELEATLAIWKMRRIKSRNFTASMGVPDDAVQNRILEASVSSCSWL